MHVLATLRWSAAVGCAALCGYAASAAYATTQVTTQLVAKELQNPWAVAFLPDGRYLVTERPGRMRIIDAHGHVHAPIEGVPEVVAVGQGGLLDVQLDSDFARNRTLYFCYAEAAPSSGNGTALARAQLSADARRLDNVQVIFTQKPKKFSNAHFGCRIVERSDGTLLLTLGERSSFADEAQALNSHLGKIVRIHKDGSVPADNPFVGRKDALPEIWSYGHRSPQGAALAPDGTFWMHEHGPQGGDEVNRPEPGKNYGWPVITYGQTYAGGPVGAGITAHAGMEQPLHHWVPSIAPSGMAFITSDRYPGWQGQMVVGALRAQKLVRLTLQGQRITEAHDVLPDLGQRVRDVRQGPDGWLYLLTDSHRGQLLRVVTQP